MIPPRSLIERMQDCCNELEAIIDREKAAIKAASDAGTPEISLGELLAAWHHFSVIGTQARMLLEGGLHRHYLMQLEASLISAHKECGTSLDLRGMTYINVYQHDRVQTLYNTWDPVRLQVASVLIYEDEAPRMKQSVEAHYGHQARPQTAAEIEDGFISHFEVVIEPHSAIVLETPSRQAMN